MWRRRRRKRSRKRAGRRGDRSGRKKETEEAPKRREGRGGGGGGQDLFPRSEPARTLDTICVAPSTIIVWTEKYAHEAPWVISDVSRARRKRQYTVCVCVCVGRGKEDSGTRGCEQVGGGGGRKALMLSSPWCTYWGFSMDDDDDEREPRGPRHSRGEWGGGALHRERAPRERGSFRCPAARARADPALR